ncbi:hypothetical protein ACQYRI_18750 [Salmonella enterica]
MKRITLLLITFLFSASVTAAINTHEHPARNMDDVQSLGVIYINHNSSQQNKALPGNPEQCSHFSQLWIKDAD